MNSITGPTALLCLHNDAVIEVESIEKERRLFIPPCRCLCGKLGAERNHRWRIAQFVFAYTAHRFPLQFFNTPAYLPHWLGAMVG